MTWRPTASLTNLRSRAELLKKIRAFFESLNVLEVDTPLIGRGTTTDPFLMSFETQLLVAGKSEQRFLQTSPEFPMKRLLAAGYGSIYQICKAFRNGETSRRHNPEFTILEWYQVGYDHLRLMTEVAEFLTWTIDAPSADRIKYVDLFQSYFSINPHLCSIEELMTIATQHQLNFQGELDNRDLWLDLLMTHIIEPTLGQEAPIFIYDYPASQAALAKIRQENGYAVGERFEVYYKGIELANGYHELSDPDEQLLRFQQDNQIRLKQGLPEIPLDEFFLQSIAALPECAGVALGVDRLACLAIATHDIDDVLAFPSLYS